MEAEEQLRLRVAGNPCDHYQVSRQASDHGGPVDTMGGDRQTGWKGTGATLFLI